MDGHRLIQEMDSYIENIDYVNETGYIKSGFELIDDANEGLEDFGTTYISARPNVGKTLLGQCIAECVAKQGHEIAFFSYEMNMKKLQDRFFQMITGISIKEMRYLRQYDRKQFDMVIEVIKGAKHLDKIIIFENTDFKTAQDISDIMSNQLKRVKFFVVDYIQRLKPMEKDDDERITIAKSSMVLHELCINQRKQGIILLQAPLGDKNATEMRFSKGSSNIEEDAEVGIFLEQEIDSIGKKTISAYMYKNKNGDKCHHRYKYKINSRLEFQLVEQT